MDFFCRKLDGEHESAMGCSFGVSKSRSLFSDIISRLD